jgi:polo-like kinase 1
MDANNNQQPAKTDADINQVVFIEERISKVSGDFAIKRYARGKLLGKGGFAKCYEITNLETKKAMAAKIIVKSSLTKSRARQKLISEIKIHKSLHHENIVGFEHVFEDQENVYILLEICANQTLSELLKRRKRLTELEVQCYVVQIISALKYLHGNRVIHRDLKLGNLFLSDKMEIKIGDFGLATKLEFDGEKKRTICGTPNYIAPEILDGKIGHSYEVDVWSLGVICYTLLVGKPPFETPDVKTTYKKIRMNSYSFPDHVPLSDSAKELITRILNLDPARRPTLDEIIQHPFFNNGGTIPKLLPVSTLACPPSASYLRQFLSQGNPIKATQQPQRLIDTAPISNSAVGGKLAPNQRSNLISTDRVSLSKPQTPGGAGDVITNQLDRQASTKNGIAEGWNPGATNQNFNHTNSTNVLKDSMRSTVQQKDFKSSQTIGNMQTLKSVNSGGMLPTMSTNPSSLNPSKSSKTGVKSEVWVKKWVDYSSKYGLGYLLSNGVTGVFFNDSSKIILDPKGSNFEYMERRASDKQDIVSSYTLSDYPKDLQKKVTLLQHFRSYLEGDGKNDNDPIQLEEDGGTKAPTVYVKKWMKTKHAIMFRLSNKIVQVNFTDKTEIILSSELKMVTYVNKKGERNNYPLATALESSNTEMAKRLRYTKEILTHMLNNNNPGGQNAQVPAMPGMGDPLAKEPNPITERS